MAAPAYLTFHVFHVKPELDVQKAQDLNTAFRRHDLVPLRIEVANSSLTVIAEVPHGDLEKPLRDVANALDFAGLSLRGATPEWRITVGPPDPSDAARWALNRRYARRGIRSRRLAAPRRVPLALLVLLVAMVCATWPVPISTWVVVTGAAVALSGLVASCRLWRANERGLSNTVLSAAATVATVLLFGCAYATAALHGAVLRDEPALRGATAAANAPRPEIHELGSAMYVAASIGAAPDVKLRHGAIIVAHVQRVLFLGLLTSAVIGILLNGLALLRVSTDTRDLPRPPNAGAAAD